MSELAFVYIIGSPNGPSKIGYSLAPERRVADLQRKSTVQLFLMGSWPVGAGAALATERYAHWLLREHAIANEWFNVSPTLAREAIEAALAEGVDPDYPLPRLDVVGREIRNGEHISAKFPKGTRARLHAVSEGCHSQLIREAVEAELKRREKTKR